MQDCSCWKILVQTSAVHGPLFWKSNMTSLFLCSESEMTHLVMSADCNQIWSKIQNHQILMSLTGKIICITYSYFSEIFISEFQWTWSFFHFRQTSSQYKYCTVNYIPHILTNLIYIQIHTHTYWAVEFQFSFLLYQI